MKEYSRKIQEEAEVELDRQLLTTDSYNFGQHFDQIEDYKEQKPRIVLGDKKSVPVQRSEKSFQADDHVETEIALPMSYSPSKQSPKTRTMEHLATSQDFDSGSSKEDNYFAGLQKDTPNNFKSESPEDLQPRRKPSELESYDGVFDAEEKAIRDHNISVIKHDL